MELVSEELVEETWQEVADFTPKQMSKSMKEISKQQPQLLAFMMEFTQDLDQEVRELSIYMFYNIFRMFKKSYQKRINKISSKDIIKWTEPLRGDTSQSPNEQYLSILQKLISETIKI